ncbi:MAG: ExbD/TolR family protein, partial [Planctomycetota bacterium]|jgi:biopolymer transport protein ExbD
MTFGRAHVGPASAGRPGAGAAAAVIFGASALALFFSLVLAGWMLPALERRERAVPLSLAPASTGTLPVRLSAYEVVVHVTASGEVRAGGKAVTVTDLAATLARLVEDAGDAALTVRADEKAPQGLVARVLTAARKAGIREASLLLVEGAGGDEDSGE